MLRRTRCQCISPYLVQDINVIVKPFPAALFDQPVLLKKLHLELDNAVDYLYNPSGFASDAERLRFLFHLYKTKADQHNASIDQWC